MTASKPACQQCHYSCTNSRPYGSPGLAATTFIYLRGRRYKCLKCGGHMKTYEFSEAQINEMLATLDDHQRLQEALAVGLKQRNLGAFLKKPEAA